MAKKLLFGHFAFISFLMLVCIMFFGCQNEKVFCNFSDDEDIILMLNTKNSTKELKISSNTNYEASWDENIIDYNTQSGIITAKQEGKTQISVSYYKNSQKQTKSVNIKVLSPAYATSIILQDSYVFSKGSGKNSVHPNIKTINNKDYNLNITYEVSNKSVAIVDGINIIPQGVGECDLIIKAVSGYNSQENEYTFISQRAKLIVQEGVQSASILVLNSEKQELTSNSQNKYELFYGGDSSNYYIKLFGERSLKNYNISLNDKNFFEIFGQIEYNGDNQAIIPLTLKNFGETNITIILKDSENNFVLQSNSLDVLIYKRVSEKDITIKSTKEYCDDNELSEAKLTNLEPKGGKYKLYKIDDTSLDKKAEAIKDKKYFYGLICFDNFDANCYNDIDAEVVNLKVNKNFDGFLKFETIEGGDASLKLKLTALDGSVFSKLFEFDVEKVFIESFEPIEGKKITLSIGESFDFCPKNANPIYGFLDYDIALTGDVLELSGTKVEAINLGKSELTLRIKDQSYFYEIEVINTNYELGLNISNCIIDGIYKIEIEISIFDSNNQKVNVFAENIKVLEAGAQSNVIKNENYVVVESLQKLEHLKLEITLKNSVLTKEAVIVWEA
ncbi:MAG: hypothetical protein IJ837_02355 [Clostridia bacterium]|nr:hypothetical protein [Clostridia bacterium]